MTPERPELRLVRESLEAVVAPTIVSSVVFEALEASGGRLPDGTDGARTFVDGPLRSALARRLGDDAHPIVGDLVTMLGNLSQKAVAATEPKPWRRDLEVTREVFLDDRPVIVAVVAG